MHKTKHILATDLDGTLVGDPQELQHLLKFYQQQAFEITLIYITGRYYESALSLIRQEKLPIPDLLVTDVGTSIHFGEDLSKDLEWASRMQDSWMPEEIDEIAASVQGMTKQPFPLENRRSYFVEDFPPVKELQNKLHSFGIPHKLIFSGGRDVDVLPSASGKGQALEYIFKKYGIEDAKVLVAGDSGNDLEMLTLGFPSVIVGNAQPELLETPDHPQIFRATRPCAGGIHEAWLHFYGE